VPTSPAHDEAAADRRLAVTAEVLYLGNLLLVPGIAFLALAVMRYRRWEGRAAWARCHLYQAWRGSLWAGVLLLLVSVGIFLLGGWQRPGTWVLLILYLTSCHATLVLFGVLGLARAMAGQAYRFPLIGVACP